MKILITGGHVTPALAVIDKLPDHKIVFIGRKYPIPGEKTISLEYKEITRRGIKFINLKTGRFTRVFSIQSLWQLLLIPYGLLQSFKIIYHEKPDKILSFGGYIALPICISAIMRKIPIFIHEQTISTGLSNKLIAKYARRVFISFKETSNEMPKGKTILTGNPVRLEIFQETVRPFEIRKTKPVLYITGGSLGAHSLNMHIRQILQRLLENFIVIHQIGETEKYDDFSKFTEMVKNFSEETQKNYFPKIHFSGEEIGYVYHVSDIVIGRAGANTFFELVALKKPAVFVPLPWSANGEQQKQANLFKDYGCGEVFDQRLESTILYDLIQKVLSKKVEYQNSFKNLPVVSSLNAADTIKKEILAA